MAVAQLDLDGCLIFANRAARGLVGVMPDPRGSALTQTAKHRVRDARTGLKISPAGRFERAVRGEALEPAEYLFRSRGSKIDRKLRVTESAIRLSDGRIAGVAFTAVELPLVDANELSQSDSIVHRVVEAITLGIIVRDATGKIVMGNAAAKTLFGAMPRGARRPSPVRSVDASGGELDHNELPTSRAVRSGDPVHSELYEAELADETHTNLMVDAVPVKDAHGEIVAVISTYADVTEERERRAAVSDRNAEIDSFSELARRIAAGQTFDQVAGAALRMTTPLMHADMAYVLDVDSSGQATIRASLDLDDAFGVVQGNADASIVALRSPTSTDDLQPRSKLLDGATSLISVPIEIDGRRIGVIAWSSKAPQTFGPDALRFGTAVAALLAVSVRHDGVEGVRPERAIVLGRLTTREREVLVLMARGFTNKEVARRLRVSYTTERGYVRGVIEKLGARSRIEAVAHALEAGLLPG